MMKRNVRPKGLFAGPFALSFFVFAFWPTQIGFQDIASLLARQPAVTAQWGQHIRASAFGTIHAATFSFSRPIGTSVPQPLSYQLASLDSNTLPLGPWNAPADDPSLQFPTVDRSVKGDRQPVLRPSKAEPQADSAKAPDEELADPAQTSEAVAEPAPALRGSIEADQVESVAAPAEAVPPKPEQPAVTVSKNEPVAATEAETKRDSPEAAENPPEDIPDPIDVVVADAPDFAPPEPVEPVVEMARLYFGNQPLGDALGAIEKWAPGEEPTIVAPPALADPDIKQSALDPQQQQQPEETKGGESIAPKGEVTGEGKRPTTPAERLHLEGKTRNKAEKCLADAVYFEARGEPVRGQIAVAQVVMNRVFSGFYPRNVCSTVYQNAHRRLSCQFTFACDGIPDVVTEPQAWVRATRIARDVLDGKYWLPEVNRATHYHAYWVRPSWVREMKRLYKFGVHTFYRPRRWGDGSDEPSWGTAAATSEAIAKL
jgi:spore germination cell wall hydrolase CwlJ-like protein